MVAEVAAEVEALRPAKRAEALARLEEEAAAAAAAVPAKLLPPPPPSPPPPPPPEEAPDPEEVARAQAAREEEERQQRLRGACRPVGRLPPERRRRPCAAGRFGGHFPHHF